MVEFSKEELEYLLSKKEDRFGGYGSFLGMVWNQAIQTNKDPIAMLKKAVEFTMTVDKMVGTYKEQIKEDLPQF